MVLVQTKSDLKDKQEYSDDEVNELNSKLNTKLFLTWAKDDINVKEVFEYLADVYLTNKEAAKKNKTEDAKTDQPIPTIKTINNPTSQAKKAGGRTVTLNAKQSAPKKPKKKGVMGWCSIH